MSVIELTESQCKSLCDAEKLIASLTPTEQQVAKLATLGYTTKEISSDLRKSRKTVEKHIESITNKARGIYESNASFRGRVVLELRCYYFIRDC